jgi:two-component system response regulator FixJ
MSHKPVIHVVDDDPAVREGLQALLAVKGHEVAIHDSAEAFLSSLPPDAAGCVLADVRMPGMSGLELQRELKRRNPGLPVIIITGHGDIPMAVAALKAGAVDFLEKPFDSDAILASIDEAMGRVKARRDEGVDEAAARVALLTPRERDVMDLVVAGHPNKIIAHRLNIALRTVEIHRARVMDKTGARNLSELIRMAIRLERSA